MNYCKKAFVLIFTMTILSLVTLFTHQLMRMVNTGTHLDNAMVAREKAEMLALGGINLAISQLTMQKETPPEKENQEEQTKRKKKELSDFLSKVLPHLNRWQEFQLKEEIDGIDGEVKICISCENGKININEAFDFKKQDFKPIYKQLLKSLQLRGSSAGQFLKTLTTFLKKRQRKIDDISELQTGTGGIVSQLFYSPPVLAKKPNQSVPNETIAIQDIFTIWTNTDKLEALFLSDSTRALLGLKRPGAYDAELQKELFKKITEKFDPGLDQNSAKYWETVRPLYQPKPAFKPENIKIFSSKFEPSTYSVLSSGKVGNVEQQILAIIKKIEPSRQKEADKKQPEKETAGQKEKGVQKENGQTDRPSFKVVRLYWI